MASKPLVRIIEIGACAAIPAVMAAVWAYAVAPQTFQPSPAAGLITLVFVSCYLGIWLLLRVQARSANSELKALGESFNGMIAALAMTQQELIKSNEMLEDRIRQRTFELEIAMKTAMAASQAKSDFLANISHELRTPMNGVLGMLNITLETPLTADQKDHMETAQQCAYSLLAVLNDILDLSKIEAGRMELECVPLDLTDLLMQAAKTHAALGRVKGVELRTEISALPEQLEGDPLRLRQILTNLLSNAIKFTEKGTVTLRARMEGEQEDDLARILIEVEDTGIGIEKDQQDYIFESFAQADNSIGRRFGGTGLGLAITRSLVERHDGTITVESEPGVGSTFSVHLELTVPAPKEKISVEPASKARILLVEDNAVNQKLVSAILTRAGYSVVSAWNGAEAMEALERETFGVVLMDVQMPVLDGLEATRRLRAIGKFEKLPIIAMTARAMDGDREDCMQAGMNSFVSKPINREHLLRVIEGFSATHSASALP